MFRGKSLRCDCGYRLKARGEDEQVAEIRRHAHEAHGIVFSAEEALLVLLRSELESSGGSLLSTTKEGEK
jgi:predicted small metal-binding protein